MTQQDEKRDKEQTMSDDLTNDHSPWTNVPANLSVLHGTETDEMPPDVAAEAEACALSHRIAYLESELARIRPVYKAACAYVDAEGPLLPWDRRRDSICVAVDAARGHTAEEAIAVRLRELP